MDKKMRKTINVSLQSKKYQGPMNELISGWEEDGYNVSAEICERLLLLDKLYQSATFLQVLNIYEITEKMAAVYHIEDKQTLEEIFAQVIKIDNAQLSNTFMTLNQIVVKGTADTMSVNDEHSVSRYEEPPIEERPVEQEQIPVSREPRPVSRPAVTPIQEPEPQENTFGGMEIPLDFLMNS